MGAMEEAMKFVVEKLKESTVPAAIENLGTELGFFNDWIARSREKIHEADPGFPFLGAPMVLLVVVCLCGCCCCCGGNARTMKAPGRDRRITSQSLERNPRGYFRNLRSHSD